jgi:uncharacterized protein YdaU (DUF1376 family)
MVKGRAVASPDVARGTPRAPDPLVPAEVDIRGFNRMPVDVVKLDGSSLWRRATNDPRVAHAAVSLWMAAWVQTPHASLPDDDELLAGFAHCTPEEWQRVKPRALAHFVKCSDGRLYHPVVAEYVMEAWTGKLERKERTAKARAARAGSDSDSDKRRNSGSDKRRDSGDDKQCDSGSDSARALSVTSSNGTERSGTERNVNTNTSVNPDGFTAPQASPPTPRDAVFALGLPLLTAGGVTEPRARSMLGFLSKTHGEAAVVDALNRCANSRPVEPVAWLQAALGVTMGKAETKSERIARRNAEAVRRFEAKGNPP